MNNYISSLCHIVDNSSLDSLGFVALMRIFILMMYLRGYGVMKLINKQWMKKWQKRREQGLTLIEASMVLALSAVVVAGAVVYYNSASENNKLQAAQGQLGSIESAVRTLYAGQRDFAGLTNATLRNNTMIPANMRNAAGDITSPWGGVVTVTGRVGALGVRPTFTVTMADIPVGACVNLASKDLGPSLLGTTATTTGVTPTGRPTMATASVTCADRGNGFAATPTWVFQ